MRRHRPYEWTCRCSVYSFPHRFGGGDCTGRYLTYHAWDNNSQGHPCISCACNEGDTCSVADGREDIKMCEVWQEYVRYREIRIYK
jgi:hypothetical protein